MDLCYATLALSLLGLVGRVALKSSPRTLAFSLLLLGAVKLGMAVLLIVWAATLECPEGCQCTNTGMLYIYPCIAAVAGVLWLMRGCIFLKLSKKRQGELNADASASSDEER
uniref:Uncharacterized protein n=1 Tax=Alexandrium catenella TaxID=2925 RepID=A0A7S1QNP1_ALECA|mmetsp:Transcript_35670/g.96791  ORF Transcript_35670/g.96791 Transcript_35670/m.96791 type:complete len:112 (+) Transcript_35670:167-502(+)|eukprot:CAMPEP_0171182626 /NCGR_PEP_ID=MMETSP0790-20130122/14864_1 /TAXON_ID=2925 /ORGANISM="Alexandrium catenella, Strain OF101" /LENGTH=111 /DNA_ID=CAMNT_0011647585 /DNA_START=155 /DNA_END=490 /DNA_ORIENTATION=-